MNNSYFSYYGNDNSYEYSLPSTSTYYYSPSVTSCPIHSPYSFYSSSTPSSMIISPIAYSHYQQQQQSVPIMSSPVTSNTNTSINLDRTPLRRHQCFKKQELQILHQIYIQDSYPSNDILQQLAVQLNVSVDKVRQWFKNRRHSDKQKKRTTARTTTSAI